MITVGLKTFQNEQEYLDYLTSLKVFQADVNAFYDEVGTGVFVRKEPDIPGGADVFVPLANLPAETIPGDAMDTGEATTRRLSVTCKEGINVSSGDKQLFSTGRVRPGAVNGWSNPGGAIGEDNSYAHAALVGSNYTPEMVCSGFDFDVPDTAEIVGVVVRVKRRKL